MKNKISMKEKIVAKVERMNQREEVCRVHRELCKWFSEEGFEIRSEKKMTPLDSQSSFVVFMKLDDTFIEKRVIVTGISSTIDEEPIEVLELEELTDVINLSIVERAFYECLREEGWTVEFVPIEDEGGEVDYYRLDVEKTFTTPVGKVLVYIDTKAYKEVKQNRTKT